MCARVCACVLSRQRETVDYVVRHLSSVPAQVCVAVLVNFADQVKPGVSSSLDDITSTVAAANQYGERLGNCVAQHLTSRRFIHSVVIMSAVGCN